MIRRDLEANGNTKVLTLDPFLLEYLGLNNTNTVDIRIENDTIILSRSMLDNNKVEDNSTLKKSRPSQYIRDFFKDGRLTIGSEVVYYQAVEEGKTKVDDLAIQAVVVADANGNQKYLMSKKDNNLYSFSGLRKRLISDFELKEVHPDWLFNMNNEWREVKSNKKLSEL